jgi:hypothetical protein
MQLGNFMLRSLFLFLFVVFGAQAYANECPEKYRFVDFGVVGNDGVLRRGGTILRAFDENNTHLLVPSLTICLPVERLAKDGRSLPVPVAASVVFNLEVVKIGVTSLSVHTVQDAEADAVANATRHESVLAQPGTQTLRGENFLCASAAGRDDVSCQLVSPYEGDAPLVVYCSAQQCAMPVLGVNARLTGSATWPRNSVELDAVGHDVSTMVTRVFDFLGLRF